MAYDLDLAYGLAEVHLLVEQGLGMRRGEVSQLAEASHVDPRLEHDKDVRDVVVRDLLRVGAHVESGRAVRAPQPDAADLVAVDVAQRLTVQDVLQVRCRIVRRRCCCGNLADLRLILEVSFGDPFAPSAA